MKRIILLLLLLTFCTGIFSQQRTEPYRKFTKAELMPGFAQNGFPMKAFPSAGIRIVLR